MFILGVISVIFIIAIVGIVYVIVKIEKLKNRMSSFERTIEDSFRNTNRLEDSISVKISDMERNNNQEISELYRRLENSLEKLHNVINSEVDSRMDKLLEKFKKHNNEANRS